MSPDLIKEIITAVNKYFHVLPQAEISMEANPGTVDQAYLDEIKAIGINRLSFGAQSAVASELILLERTHTFETVIEAVEICRAAGFHNLNLDFIYGLPGQSLASWESSLRAALDLNPPHFSLYCLTIEAGTSMHRWLKNGQIQAPDPDLAADQYHLASTLLAGRGYEHYEISNWARPGYACAHNLAYWRNQTYLGLGAGAHGQAAGYRYAVVKQPRVYLRRMATEEPAPYPLSSAVSHHHRIGRREAMTDTIMMQLRLLQEGLDLVAFEQKFGQPLPDAYPGAVEQLQAWGLVTTGQDRLRLTEKGRFLSNQVFICFMDG